jgi:CRISPR-associated protein Cmr4
MPTHPDFNLLPNAFVIRALTNLHAGAGGESYGMIDNLVQRDKATGFPVIHSSSLKGSLRELMEDGLSPQPINVASVFGGDTRRNKPDGTRQDDGKGSYKFLEAELLSLPVRSDRKLFFSVTCPKICNRIIDLAKQLKFSLDADLKSAIETIVRLITTDNNAFHFDMQLPEVKLEEEDITAIRNTATIGHLDKVKKLFGSDLAIVSDAIFEQLCDDYHLPVIARNQLDNGISENLWYEQVLPRETRLLFYVLSPNPEINNDFHLSSFTIALEGNPVQIGANASVGYGYCEVKKLTTLLT